MAILQPATSVSSQTAQQFKPTSSQVEVNPAQQQALASVVPRDSNESAAVQAQQRLLGGSASMQPQQSVVESRVNVLGAQQLSSSTQVDSGVQVSALATAQNRENLLTAVRNGVDMWRLHAHFQNITIMSVNAIGTAGCLQGPQLAPLIMQAPAVRGATGHLLTLVNAVASGVSTNFSLWQTFVTVPGLPWYPAFAAWPGPFAPPRPNIPMPLIVCPSSHSTKLMSSLQLEQAIRSGLGAEFDVSEMDQFLGILSVRLANYFTAWMCSQMIMMVMGMGPVPSFAAPFVPVGPVMGGYIIPSPGHLVA